MKAKERLSMQVVAHEHPTKAAHMFGMQTWTLVAVSIILALKLGGIDYFSPIMLKRFKISHRVSLFQSFTAQVEG